LLIRLTLVFVDRFSYVYYPSITWPKNSLAHIHIISILAPSSIIQKNLVITCLKIYLYHAYGIELGICDSNVSVWPDSFRDYKTNSNLTYGNTGENKREMNIWLNENFRSVLKRNYNTLKFREKSIALYLLSESSI
jgi:hypothetical protein